MTLAPFANTPAPRSSRMFFLLAFATAACCAYAGNAQTFMLASANGAPASSSSSTLAIATLPEAPSFLTGATTPASASVSSSFPLGSDVAWASGVETQQTERTGEQQGKKKNQEETDVDANGNPIPVERHQTHRIGGIIPNYRAVSGGAVAHPPGWKYNFKVATRQAFDYSGFVFLGITSLSAEALDEHRKFGKGIGGFYTYTWHGFIDKTDGTYLQAWLLPSLLHEDTRYYAMGNQQRVSKRILYVISRQAVARTYSGHNTPNIAGLGGKVLTQYISRFYYPANTAGFGTLAQKFGFSVARDIGFTALREFYPDYLGYQARKKQKHAAALSALDTAAINASTKSQGTPAATVPSEPNRQPPQ